MNYIGTELYNAVNSVSLTRHQQIEALKDMIQNVKEDLAGEDSDIDQWLEEMDDNMFEIDQRLSEIEDGEADGL